MHKITNLWKFELNRSSKLRDNNERKNTLVTQSCVLSDALWIVPTLCEIHPLPDSFDTSQRARPILSAFLPRVTVRKTKFVKLNISLNYLSIQSSMLLNLCSTHFKVKHKQISKNSTNLWFCLWLKIHHLKKALEKNATNCWSYM